MISGVLVEKDIWEYLDMAYSCSNDFMSYESIRDLPGRNF